ncbi:hypothetical protein ACQKMD_20110 [Viridibacillus sp. NPDC096237]
MNEFLIGGKQGFIRIEITEVFGFPLKHVFMEDTMLKERLILKVATIL